MDKSIDIEKMIAAENDPQQRAFLIVLNSINQNLIANTNSTQHIAHKLDTHLTQFDVHVRKDEAIINKGAGAWKVAAWVLGSLQIIAIALAGSFKADLNTMQSGITNNRVTGAQLQARVERLEANK